MDISLNICNNVQNISNKQKKNLLNSNQKRVNKKKSFSNNNSSGFSFQFTKNDKVKAIVARKRAKKVINETTKTNKIAQEEKLQESIKKVEDIPSTPGRFVLRKNYVSSDDENYENNSEKLEQIPTADLSKLELNVSTDITSLDLNKIQKQKMSREERRKLQREKKFKDRRPNDKVLTAEELKEGIRKFSEIPEKKKRFDNKSKIKSENLFTGNDEIKTVGQRLVKPVTEKVFTGLSISSLDLHPHCVKNLADILNITELTTVQQMTIPKALEGKDCLVRSQTGSGKTLAYALPIVQKLQEIRPKLTRNSGIQAVIIVPSRELALQTYELFIKLLKPFTWLVSGILTGGEKRKAEKARLRKGINILIGTPGRLCDHLLHTDSFRLDKLKFLILDEADRLLELGYERDVKKIVDGIQNHKAGKFTANEIEKSDLIEDNEQMRNISSSFQRILLSATLTSAVQKLAGLTLKDPIFIDTSDETSVDIINEKNYEDAVHDAVEEGKLVIPDTVKLCFITVPPKLRLVTLSGILAKECKNKTQIKILVFMSTTEMINFHHDLLNETLTNKVLDEDDEPNDEDDEEEPLLQGIKFFKLHGSMTQQERSGVFKSFREIKSGILLATDVAGRGIDVPEVDLVVQYSPPQKISEFVHRVGRTGRAGKSGQAIIFLTPNELDFVRILEDNRIRISQVNLEPYLDVLFKVDSGANTSQEAASNLQHRFEKLVDDDKEMHEKACKAFVSWIRFYSAFPKELKNIFNQKTAHMGHFAKSFALREEPKLFIKKHTTPKQPPPINKLTFTERDLDNRKKEEKRNPFSAKTKSNNNNLKRFLSKSISLTTSEYDSGLLPLKRKKKH